VIRGVGFWPEGDCAPGLFALLFQAGQHLEADIGGRQLFRSSPDAADLAQPDPFARAGQPDDPGHFKGNCSRGARVNVCRAQLELLRNSTSASFSQPTTHRNRCGLPVAAPNQRRVALPDQIAPEEVRQSSCKDCALSSCKKRFGSWWRTMKINPGSPPPKPSFASMRWRLRPALLPEVLFDAMRCCACDHQRLAAAYRNLETTRMLFCTFGLLVGLGSRWQPTPSPGHHERNAVSRFS